jgi:hypothetical protein
MRWGSVTRPSQVRGTSDIRPVDSGGSDGPRYEWSDGDMANVIGTAERGPEDHAGKTAVAARKTAVVVPPAGRRPSDSMRAYLERTGAQYRHLLRALPSRI